MTISTSGADFDMQLFDDNNPNALLKKVDSIATGGTEVITYNNPKNQTLYLRCYVPIDSSRWPGSNGNYLLQCTGNLPPIWNGSFNDSYKLDEDAINSVIEAVLGNANAKSNGLKNNTALSTADEKPEQTEEEKMDSIFGLINGALKEIHITATGLKVALKETVIPLRTLSN